MCLACEQDAIWVAYLESQGLLQPDDPAAVEALFAGFPMQPLPVRPEAGVAPQVRGASTGSAAAQKNPFICDDPKTG
jgi:hypothetical protein